MESSAFKVCVLENDGESIMSAENWPCDTIIREWCFDHEPKNKELDKPIRI